MCIVNKVYLYHFTIVIYVKVTSLHGSRDGVSTIQMYSSTITLNMHEYEYKYSENKCTRVRLLYNVLEYEYDYIIM